MATITRKSKTAEATLATMQGIDPTKFETLSVIVKDQNGKDQTITQAVEKRVLGIIASGMGQAVKLETFWKDNALAIMEGFFSAKFLRTLQDKTAAERVALIRKQGECDLMYSAFTQRHPGYTQAMQWKKEGEAKGSEAEKSKAAYNSAIASIKATANTQVRRVIDYFVKSEAAEGKASEQREQETAISLIDSVLKDWSARIENKRGNFKLEAESAILHNACEALREVKSATLKARKANAPTSMLDLEKVGEAMHKSAQVALPRDRSAEKAGTVTIIKGKQADAVVSV
jgi:hypothetical protein